MHINSKRTNWVVVTGLVIVLISLLAFQTRYTRLTNKILFVKPIDQQSIFLGNNSPVFTQTPNRVDQEIDYAWAQMHTARTYEKEGKLVEAAEYYKKGFYGLSGDMENIIPGRSMCAKYLIDVYQKLGRYDEALKILDLLERKVFTSEFGKKRAAEIRTRLLAAKNQPIPDQVHRGQIREL